MSCITFLGRRPVWSKSAPVNAPAPAERNCLREIGFIPIRLTDRVAVDPAVLRRARFQAGLRIAPGQLLTCRFESGWRLIDGAAPRFFGSVAWMIRAKARSKAGSPAGLPAPRQLISRAGDSAPRAGDSPPGVSVTWTWFGARRGRSC